MALRDIRLVPDPVLRVVCDPVLVFDDALRDLTADMLDTMYAAPGRGLAAPQIGVTARVFVMDTTWKDGHPDPLVCVNPEIMATSLDEVVLEEGCLSIPDQTVHVARPAKVSLRWQDTGGVQHLASFEGFGAACVQHELDHLNGIVTFDRLGPKARAVAETQFSETQR